MWRYYYTIIRNIFRIPEAIKTMNDMIELSKHRPDEYNEEIKYRYVQYICNVMQKTGHIKTEVYGEENLPKEGGYMMYPNHQGKYDVYGIISVHKQPCTFVMDIKKSNRPFIKELVDIIHNNNGRVFLAHPYRYNKDVKEVLEDVKDYVDGIEIYHPTANEERRQCLRDFAINNKLMMSGGSDYHGPTVKPDIDLGTGKNCNIKIEGLITNNIIKCNRYIYTKPIKYLGGNNIITENL